DIIDLVEIDETCRAFLKSKNANVIANDFLTLKTFKRYDLIIMNPPFSDGVKHILKAIEMQKYGGQIVCLLNSETINNPYTLERKVLLEKIEQYDGKVYDYGACFANSERPTDVNICCVYIDIPKGFRSDILDGLEKAKEAEEQPSDEHGQLSAELDEYMRAVVGQYQRECEAGLKLINEYNAVSKMALTSFTDEYKSPILELKIRGSDYGRIENRYLEKVRYKYWEAFFARPEICKKMTGEMQSEFYSRLGELKKIEFNLDNIYEIQIRMTKDTIGSIENAIMELFHEFARDHSWYPECAKNIHHYYNGWATNKCGVINKKVIIPLDGFHDNWDRRGGRFLDLGYTPRRKLADIEKVFSYLDTGITDCWETVDRIMERAQSVGQSQNIEFKYFTVTFYKKGTAHIVFKDFELLKRFNIFAGQREGGLPPSYGKKAYSDMSVSERAVIDEFEGEESYGEVFANPYKFLVTTENLLALT
ncbi:MAG: DUF4942 domain-containing protein, partial [Oscillospiraceae bacterium]|nr:DUF4942 domain-containing protein [Oscillospiraceae bacterium]